ncbi:FAD/NAD(P)-binding domain-containing protein [Zopfia rhizophila CBS 207.26]|uniref:FAD/NAD(P)-binding domain-containing protein n=1 Tax=Zopfia rhizophila CBS 207.26 TaxID=1314779 RepID=A0A6A6EBY6_9PEZI|nr:FAD/NAD(P)-binding domain-containing protein [Zopfia rhizophila CBS 207.26]
MTMLESNVDVLIIGAGPAGFIAATWMTRIGVKMRIIDKRGTKVFNGQADGLQCQSQEIFDSFGFEDRVQNETNHMLEFCMWARISRFTEKVLHQGRTEQFFLDHIKKHSDIEVERGVLPEALSVDMSHVEDTNSHSITLKLRSLGDEEATSQQAKGTGTQDGLFRSNLARDGTDNLIHKSKEQANLEEVVHAKYVFGCDGANRWTRHIIPLTDFPDIRKRFAIHSTSSSSLILTETKPDACGRADRSSIKPEIKPEIRPETIISAPEKILSPFTVTYNYCHRWTAYQIGQRGGRNFDLHQRIFLAGDAVHTHSPKAGQGMNVSMQDTYYLGWKVGLVVKGVVEPSILKTYQSERRRVAHDLISFDHKFSRLFSGRPAKDIMDESGVSMAEFKEKFVVDYRASMLVAKAGSSEHQGDGTGMSPSGGRKQAWLKSDGRFRIILFAGNMSSSSRKARAEAFCAALEKSDSFLKSVIEILTLYSIRRIDIELLNDFPVILHSWDEKTGWDYYKVFVDDQSHHEGHGHAYEKYGVYPERGYVVIARPHQYVG